MHLCECKSWAKLRVAIMHSLADIFGEYLPIVACFCLMCCVYWFIAMTDTAMPKKTMIKALRLLCVLLTFSAADLWAASSYRPNIVDPLFDSWRWQSFSELRGKAFHAMARAKDGSMWFGVADGVVHYDGLQWKHYTAEDGVHLTPVNVLVAGLDGSVYAAKKSGGNQTNVSRFHNGQWSDLLPGSRDMQQQGQAANLQSVYVLADGTVWAGTNFGAIYIKDGEFTAYTTKPGTNRIKRLVPDAKVIVVPRKVRLRNRFAPFDIAQDNNGRILFATENGVMRFDMHQPDAGMAWDAFKLNESVIGWGLKVYQTSDGKVWLINGDLKNKARYLDPVTKTWTIVNLEKYGGSSLNDSILETQDGTLWISGHSRLHAFKNGQWTVYESSQLNLPIGVIHLLENQDGSLWIGVRYGEAFRVDYSNKRWLSYDNLHFQCETKDQRKWFIEKSGLAIANDPTTGQWTSYSVNDGLISTPVVLLASREGELFAAGSHNGRAATAIFNGRGWDRKVHTKLGIGIEYRSVYEAQDGSVWFGSGYDRGYCEGCRGGFVTYNSMTNGKPQWVHIASPKIFPRVIGVAQASNGELWYGNRSHVYVFDGQQSRLESEIERLSPDWTDDLHNTADGSIWVVKGGVGLFRFDGDKWTKYTVNDGLASNMVASILGQPDQTMWAATNKGISRFDGKYWTPHVLPEEIAFGRESGTLRQSKGGALWVNLAPREWFLSAVNLYVPRRDNIKKPFKTIRYIADSYAPETLITMVEDEILDWDEARFSWQGLDHWESTPSEKIQYSYRIDNGEWSRFSEQAAHTFTSLASSTHTIQIRARDLDFNIDQTPAHLEFTIVPPFWRRLWFIATIVLLLSISAILSVRSYTDRNQKIARLKRRLGKTKERLHRMDVELIKSREDSFQLMAKIEELNRVEVYIDFNEKKIVGKSNKEFEFTSLAKNYKNEIFNLLECMQRWDKTRIHLIEFGLTMPDVFLKAVSEKTMQDFSTKGKFGRVKYGINKTFRVNCGKELILRDQEKIHVYFKLPHDISLIKSSAGDLVISKEEITKFDKTEVASFQGFDAFDYHILNGEIVVRSNISESREAFKQAVESDDMDFRIEQLDRALDLDDRNYEALKLLIQHNIFKYINEYKSAISEIKEQIENYSNYLKSDLYYEKNRLNIKYAKEQYKEIYGVKLISKEKLRDIKEVAQKSPRQIIKYEKRFLRQKLRDLKELNAYFDKYNKYVEALQNVITYYGVAINSASIGNVVATWTESPHLYNRLLRNTSRNIDAIEAEMKILFLQNVLDLHSADEKVSSKVVKMMVDYLDWHHEKFDNRTSTEISKCFESRLNAFFANTPQADKEHIERLFKRIREPASIDIMEYSSDSSWNSSPPYS